MISIIKWLKKYKKEKQEQKKQEKLLNPQGMKLRKNLKDNMDLIKNIMNNSFDIKDRIFKIAGYNINAGIIYIENLVSESTVLDHVVKSLTSQRPFETDVSRTPISLDILSKSFLSTGSIRESGSLDEIILAILSGDTFLSVQGFNKGLIISTMGLEGRTIGEPILEPSIKGPKEGFIETLRQNIGLIRRRLKDPNLTIELLRMGRRSKSNVLILYIKGIVDENLVTEVKNRLSKIDTDLTIEASQIGHLISDNTNSIFPLIQLTERPDKVVSALTEARVAIMVDGSPHVLVVPVTMPMQLQSVDDYYENWFISTIIRLTRYVCVIISIFFPALYIAITGFHPGMLPTDLALSITSTRGGVPFPAFLEALLMEFTLEILQEAGIRLPRVVGETVSIVGGLVIGQAAVQAGIISPIMVIVIAVTAIASFAIPDYSLSLSTRILRVPFMVLATTLGLFGVAIGALYLLGYVADQKSFGTGYLRPLTPYRPRDLKDSWLRAPQWTFGKRPEFLNPQDTQRQIIGNDAGTSDEE